MISLDLLLAVFEFEFMRNALLISVLVAIPTALLSCFLVLKGWSLMGDAISHAVFPGVVISYIVGLPLAVGAFAAGMSCALLTGYLKENSRIKQDTVMGVVFSGMFGFGLVLYTKIQSDVHLDHILFGDMLGIGWPDIIETGLIALVATGILAVKWRDFLLHAFDPAQAKAVGLILAIAMLIAPGAIAFLITRTMGSMLIVAVLVATVASFSGVYLSFFIDSAPAPTIVLLMTVIFLAAFLWSSWRTARIEAQRTTVE